MKIVIAPDSFKESLSAIEVARALAKGIRRAVPSAECVLVPVADGGEGTVRALVDATGGREVTKTVRGPRGDRVRARYGLIDEGHTAVIEMAAASGLQRLAPDARDPLKTTTFGTGELLRAALDRGARRIIIGIGGSATNDAGAGMAQALGVRFLDGRGRALAAGLAGGDLMRVRAIDISGIDPRIEDAAVQIACDVNNRLLGRRGATYTYGPQKGAGARALARLEDNLAHFADVIESDLGLRVRGIRGGGAAGGLGAGLVAFTGAELRKGADIVLEAVNLEAQLEGADLVVTGEGRIDAQTAFGKAPAAVAGLAGARHIPVVGVGGALADNVSGVYAHGFDALESTITRDMTLATALANAERHLVDTGERIGRWIHLSSRLVAR